MRIINLIVGVGLLVPTLANAQETVEASGKAGLGVSTGLDIAYAAADTLYNADGDKVDLLPNDGTATYMLFNLHGAYDFSGVGVNGLSAGLDLPLVRNGISIGDVDNSTTSIGDLSVFANYLFPVMPEMLDVGGTLRFKAATGKALDLAADEVATGNGSHNVQASLVSKLKMQDFRAGLEAGYIFSMSHTEEVAGADHTTNPGDLIFADLALGYVIADMVEPAVHLLFAKGTNTSAGPADGDLEEIPDSGVQYVTLAIDVNVEINEMFGAYIGLGTPLVAMGYNLPYGLVLSGKNTIAGSIALNGGVRAEF